MCGRWGFIGHPGYFNTPGGLWFMGGFLLRLGLSIAVIVLAYKLIKSFIDRKTHTN